MCSGRCVPSSVNKGSCRQASERWGVKRCARNNLDLLHRERVACSPASPPCCAPPRLAITPARLPLHQIPVPCGAGVAGAPQAGLRWATSTRNAGAPSAPACPSGERHLARPTLPRPRPLQTAEHPPTTLPAVQGQGSASCVDSGRSAKAACRAELLPAPRPAARSFRGCPEARIHGAGLPARGCCEKQH